MDLMHRRVRACTPPSPRPPFSPPSNSPAKVPLTGQSAGRGGRPSRAGSEDDLAGAEVQGPGMTWGPRHKLWAFMAGVPRSKAEPEGRLAGAQVDAPRF